MENKDTFTKVIQVPLDRIEWDDIKLRPAQLEDKAWKTFEYSIGLEGVQIPIHIRPKKDENGKTIPGYWTGIDGQQRHRASVNQNKGTIPALVRDWDTATCMRFQAILNRQRIPQKTSQLREHIKIYMIMYPDHGREEIAQEFTMFTSELSKIIGLDRLTVDAQTLLDEKKIPMTSAVILSRIPSNLQNKLLPEAIRMSVDDFANHVKREVDTSTGKATHDIRPILRKKEEFLQEIERNVHLAETHDGHERKKYELVVDRLQWGLKIDLKTLEDEKKNREDKANADSTKSLEKQHAEYKKKTAEIEAKLAQKEREEIAEEVGV